MKKLRLEMDALRVETFAIDSAPVGKGTVQGHATLACTRPVQCGDSEGVTCDGRVSCGGEVTCNAEYTCALSCTDCGTYYCATGDPSCGQFSCVYTCTSCNPYGC